MTAQPASNRPNPLVYVVDDEALVGEMIREILRLEDIDAEVYTDPAKLLEDFKTADPRPGLLLTDYVMGPMNGMELIQECKALQPDLTAVLFSGNVDEEVTRGYPHPPDAFIRKPFAPKKLLEALRRVFKNR